MMNALEERREKRSDRVHIEVVKRARRNQPPHRRNRQHQEIRRALALRPADVVGLGGPALRFVDVKRKHGANQSRNSRDVERGTPAKALREPTTYGEAQSDADRKTEHENGKRLRAFRSRKEVADQ